MRKILLLLLFLITSGIVVSAQEETSGTDFIKAEIFSSDCIYNPILNDVHLNVLDGKVFIGDRKASNNEIFNLMRITSPKLYIMHSAGKSLMVSGIVSTGTGGGLLLISGFCLTVAKFDENKDLKTAGIIFASVGAIGIVAGTPLIIMGVNLKKNAIRNFKQNCLSEDKPFETENNFQLNLNVKNNGLGLALVF